MSEPRGRSGTCTAPRNAAFRIGAIRAPAAITGRSDVSTAALLRSSKPPPTAVNHDAGYGVSSARKYSVGRLVTATPVMCNTPLLKPGSPATGCQALKGNAILVLA